MKTDETNPGDGDEKNENKDNTSVASAENEKDDSSSDEGDLVVEITPEMRALHNKRVKEEKERRFGDPSKMLDKLRKRSESKKAKTPPPSKAEKESTQKEDKKLQALATSPPPTELEPSKKKSDGETDVKQDNNKSRIKRGG